MYTATTLTDPPPRAKALSLALDAMIREQRERDPSLGVPDALVALELTKAALLEQSGVPVAGRRAALVVAAALAVAVAGFALFVLTH